jgi:CheY-like chemotaxis protein
LSGEPTHARRPLVLVVEDDELSQNYVATALQSDFETALASSASEARQQLAAHSADVAVILMDLSLKGDESGLMLTRWLRADSPWKDVPVIATTAYALPEHQRAALAAGCTVHLPKPFSRVELLAAVWKALRGTRSITAPSK